MRGAKQYNRRALANVGQAVEQTRVDKGFTRSELAEKADVHYDSLLKLERGQRSPNLSLLVRLADALDVRVVTLLGE